MRTIFDSCVDLYGMCIRQYIDAALLSFIFLIGIWSCYQTLSKRHIEPKFQIIPLTLNTLVTLLMLCLQIIYQEYYNTHLIFMLIEFFSYYLLTYTLVFMYLKGSRFMSDKKLDQQENGGCLKILLAIMCFRCGTNKLNFGFAVGSLIILLVTITVTVLSFVDLIKCTSEYWVSTLVLLIFQIPIYIVTLVYCSRTKKEIKKLSEKATDTRGVQSTMHLFKDEDSYIKLKIIQTNLFQITFTISIILHIAQLLVYTFMDNESLCIEGTNQIEVRNGVELSIMSIKNVSQIIPHLMILLIFWVIPQKANRQAPTDLYISPKMVNPKLESNWKLDDEDEQIHKKLIQ